MLRMRFDKTAVDDVAVDDIAWTNTEPTKAKRKEPVPRKLSPA